MTRPNSPETTATVWFVACLGAVAILASVASPADAQRRVPPPSREAVQYSYAPIVRKAAPAVVNVFVRKRVRAFRSPFANDPFFRRFFGDRFGRPSERLQNSLGSGVIVTPDGVVVTNTHVIKGSEDTEIRVVLADQREFDAKVITQDENTDIAILKIEADGEVFPTVTLGDSDGLEVGDLVLAIGNPFGVGQTVTSGIISALARTEVGRSDQQVFIQTDAAINPGNSGGGLFDISGQLVGINTMIFSRTGGSHGIGFAIPTNLVRLYVEGAVTGREVRRPWLGAKLNTVTRDIAEPLGLNRISGAFVEQVYRDGPAAAADLQLADVITHVNGREVRDARSVIYRLSTIGVGKTARLRIIRQGQPKTLKFTIQPLPSLDDSGAELLTGDHPLDGAKVANIGGAVSEQLDLADERGVAIVSIAPRSVAKRLGFRSGDVVFEVGRREVTDVESLIAELNRPQRYWLISVLRGGRKLHLRLPG
jgi:Do/DeqQ family serine protease